MKQTLFAIGTLAVMFSVSPAFAEAETNHFTALDGVTSSAPMNDNELAAIEGQAPPFLLAGQAGLVNVVAQVSVDNVRVIRDITVQDVNVQILGSGNQR